MTIASVTLTDIGTGFGMIAIVMGGGFAGLRWLLSRLDARFERIEARFERIEARFAEQDAKIEARFAEQDAKIEARFAEQDAKIEARFAEQDARFTRLERELHRVDKGLVALTATVSLLAYGEPGSPNREARDRFVASLQFTDSDPAEAEVAVS